MKLYTRKLFFALACCLFVVELSATTYYLKAGGTMTVLASWGTNTDGTGTAPTGFTGTHRWNVHNNATVVLTNTFAVSGGATVSIGDGVSALTFNYTANAKFGVTTFPNLIVTNASTLVIDKPYGTITSAKTTNQAGSTYSYSPNCDFVGSDVYSNLIIGTGTATYFNGNSTVQSVLTLNSGSLLDLDVTALTISGSIASSTGELMGNDYGSTLILNGTGNMGTLRFAAGTETLSTLDINMTTGASFVTLSGDLTIAESSSAGVLTLNNGGIQLNGNDLTVSNLATFNGIGGVIHGNTASTLNMFANSATGTLDMDATNNSLNVFNLSNSAVSLGSTMNILDSVKIDAAGALTTGGFLTLKSTSSLKARIAEISGGGSISGNITVETFIPGGTTDWANLGASGVSGLTFNDWYGQIPMAIEGSATGVTSAGGFYFESVWGWDETIAGGYDSTIAVSSPINVGQGYWVFVGNGVSSTSAITTTVSGPVVSGSQPLAMTISSNNGDCLFANPFASPISWDRIEAHNAGETDGAIYIYNADLGLTTSYASGASSPGGAGSATTTIPAGQGFYVRALTATNLDIDESDKVAYNTGADPLLKQQNPNPKTTASTGSIIRLHINGGGFWDATSIRFHPNGTTNFDNKLDAIKYFESPGYAGYGKAPWALRTTISTKMGNTDYSINSLPNPTTVNAVIPVLTKVYATGQHTIGATELNNLPPGTCVDLKDKLLNIVHDLTSSPYVCTLSDTNTVAARFELTVCANIAMGINNTTTVNENVFVKQDANGVYVDLNFEKNTRAYISANNILGQQIMEPKEVECTSGKYYLDLKTKEQIVMVNVVTNEKRTTKKIFIQN